MTFDAMDLRMLRVFQAVVEAGGLSAAQGVLNLSLATISTQLSALETRLGVRLCRRGRGGFVLTPEGRAVYEEYGRLAGSIGQFEARVRRLKGELTGTFAVGLADNTISDPAAPLERLFARFADAAPRVTLSLVTRPPHELLRDVVSGQLQAAIASFPKVALGLAYRDLYAETQGFYCGAAHPLYAQERVEIEDIQRHRIVARDYWGSRDMKIFAIPAPRAVVNDMEAGARLILSGRFLGYLPGHYAQPFVAAGRMRALRPDLLAYTAPFQAAYDDTSRKNGILPLFLRLLAEVFPG
ncbi:LysR family transcriptional regulator [Paenirhodobacter sp.]|uniref:LysR family transcriptional regulator n=1 Tax=Paenirhodobacter sp. TaxID=1965326 RepID=UPI003B514005